MVQKQGKGEHIMRRVSNTIAATAEPRGNLEAVEQLVRQVGEVRPEALVVLGNLAPKGMPHAYSHLFQALASAQVPTFYVPGPEDGPIENYMREAATIETVFPYLHGVHGTFAFASGYTLFTGMGGRVSDNQQEMRNEQSQLCYPGWEVEYRLTFLNELKDYQKVFLFTTLPAHKGLQQSGSTVLAELVKSYKPRLVLVAGKEPKHEMLGTSLVVIPGNLLEGNLTLINLHKQTIETRNMFASAGEGKDM
jgi:hypothetical protein